MGSVVVAELFPSLAWLYSESVQLILSSYPSQLVQPSAAGLNEYSLAATDV